MQSEISEVQTPVLVQSTPTMNRKRQSSTTSSTGSNPLPVKIDKQSKLDMMLVDALSKTSETQHEGKKSSDELFCLSIVETLQKLPPKKNRQAKIRIQEILLDLEFSDE